MTPTAAPRGRRLVPVRVAGAAALALLAACSSVGQEGGTAGARQDNTGGQAGDVREGGTLTLALSAEPDRLDPTLARSLYSRYVFHAMCEKLYDLDEKVSIVPQLAADLPETSEDGLTVTIPLREGVKFADGTPFDAEAVKTSIERHLSLEGSARVSDLGPIASVEAEDAQTVVITLEEPFSPLVAALSDRAGMIMSPKQLEATGEDFGNDPVCVGPFKFDKRVAQNSIELVKDPEYYDADKVHLDRIVYKIISDTSIRAANLRSGDADVADTVGTDDVETLRSDSNLTILESQSLGYQGVTFNIGNADGVGTEPMQLDTPLAQEKAVRQAFEHAVDREALTTTVFNGLFDPACGPVSPASAFTSDAAQTCRQYDPAKAKQLLKDAGVQTPYSFTMITSNTPASLQFAQALQSQVKESGFDMKIEPLEFTSLLDLMDQGKYEAVQIGWSGRPDPDGNISNFVSTGGSQNVSGYSNPELDDLLVSARQSQDDSERADLYGQVQGLLQEDAPLVYLYRQRNITGVSAKVSGVQVYPDGIIRVGFAGFAK